MAELVARAVRVEPVVGASYWGKIEENWEDRFINSSFVLVFQVTNWEIYFKKTQEIVLRAKIREKRINRFLTRVKILY